MIPCYFNFLKWQLKLVEIVSEYTAQWNPLYDKIRLYIVLTITIKPVN